MNQKKKKRKKMVSKGVTEMNKFFFKIQTIHLMRKENNDSYIEKFIQIVFHHMQNTLKTLKPLFLHSGLIHLAYNIITFIDIQTLLTIINEQHCQQFKFKIAQTENNQNTHYTYKNHSKIKHIIQVHCFLKHYLNLNDRSMYYSFYQQPQFIQISKSLEQNIVVAQTRNIITTNLASQFLQMNLIFRVIQEQELLSIDQVDSLKRILTDPSLPLPPLKRENQGIYCNSSFQLFLVGLRFPHYNQQSYTPFEQLKQQISNQQDTNFKQFFEIQKQKHSSMKVYENLHLVRYMPYEITYSNFQSLMLKENSMHNIVVTIFALTDVWIEAVFSLVNVIEDPFYQLSEMMSRYSAFRSFVIQLQDSLGFLFHSYQNVYSDTIRDSLFVSSNIKPKYCFWRPALAKWFLKMNPIHTQTNHVYFLLLTKLRQEALLSKLTASNTDPDWKRVKKHQIILRNGLQLNEYSSEMRQKIYQNMTGSSIIQQFIQNNTDTCESLVFQYVQYFIDLAVNQETVHWCGHSNHHLQKYFDLFNHQFALYNYSFVDNLKNKVMAQISQKQTKKNILQILLQADLQFLETKNVKPNMLKQFVNDINLKSMFFQDLLENCQVLLPIVEMKQPLKQEETQKPLKQIRQQILNFNFIQKDQKLKYFNQKAKICESIEGEQKFFFSIPPLLSPQEILIKSINTNDTSENEDSNSNSSFQYVSQNESEEQFNSQCDGETCKGLQKNEQKSGLKEGKKVRFQKMEEEELQEFQEMSSQKKTLHSTNSSSKESKGMIVSEQNEKCQQEEELPIIKSKSI